MNEISPIPLNAFLCEYTSAVQERIALLERAQFGKRLWAKDAGLWKDDAEARGAISGMLGWMDVLDKMEQNLSGLVDFAAEVRKAGFRHVVHMGMGGSSLAPLAFRKIFPPGETGLPVTVLDTTDPATILDIEANVPLADTLFIEASKSGSTVESRSFGEHFYAGVKALKGERAGENFAVITDPGSMLARLAEERSYRKIFLNYADIGGRYSALSLFGLVPAVLMGIDVSDLLARARSMQQACGADVPIHENPAAFLGVIMGELAKGGRDKLTFLAPPSLDTLGMWLEQLIAESTGKESKGVLPVAGERFGGPSVYGEDRLFVHFRLEGEADEDLERGVEELKEAGHPVVVVSMKDRMDLGQEFYRWEIATATAGVILGINPFDQPNVQESKDYTNNLLQKVREEGKISETSPDVVAPPLRFHTGRSASSGAEALGQFFGQGRSGDFVVLLAYLTEGDETDAALQELRLQVRDSLRLATTIGYGPRYLHSTGQFHKGGPNTGLFILLTADDKKDTEIPGQPYTFGMLRRAQALGDLQVLRNHGRRAIRVHLGEDVRRGLADLNATLKGALAGKRP